MQAANEQRRAVLRKQLEERKLKGVEAENLVAMLFSKAQNKKMQVRVCVCVDREPGGLAVQ